MKISKLIAILNNKLSELGDIDVCYDYDQGYMALTIDTVSIIGDGVLLYHDTDTIGACGKCRRGMCEC